jgi:hypothetical protein
MQRLSTFKFSTPPAELSDEELEALADLILDQWSDELESSTSPPSTPS